MATDEAWLLIWVVDSGQQKLRLKRRNDFQVVYLQDSHYSINSMPLSSVIQLTHCLLLHRLVLMSAGLVLRHTPLICRTVRANCGHCFRAQILMMAYSFKVKSQFGVSCLAIVEAKISSCYWRFYLCRHDSVFFTCDPLILLVHIY